MTLQPPHGDPGHTDPAHKPIRGSLLAIAGATLVTLPGLLSRISGATLADVVAPMVFGAAILGSAFLLAWAAEVLQLDVSQGLALTVLALIAVLPEYAVDFTFAWKAGEDPEKYAPLALANMTGSNRLLIGIGWSMVVLLAAWRMTRVARKRGYTGKLDTDVHLERPHAIEIAFLAIATLYSLTLPFKSTLTLVDGVILISHLHRVRDPHRTVAVGGAPPRRPVAACIGTLAGSAATPRRRHPARVRGAGDLRVRGAVRRVARSPRASRPGIDTFLLVQWVAPLASEAPELIIAGMFAWRLNTSAGLRHAALVEGQPVDAARRLTARSCSRSPSGTLHGLPLDSLQREELFLTAAQSVFAVAVLVSRSISVREALALFFLFIGQFILGGILPADLREFERIAVGMVYLVLAVGIMFQQRKYLRPLVRDGLVVPVDQLFHEDPELSSDPEGVT